MAAVANLQGTKLELSVPSHVSIIEVNTQLHMEHVVWVQEDHASLHSVPHPESTVRDISSFTGPIIFSDPSWFCSSDGQPTPIGLGIFMRLGGDWTCSTSYLGYLSTSGFCHPDRSFQFDACAAGLLQLQRATFLTDNATLAKAATFKISSSLRVAGPSAATIPNGNFFSLQCFRDLPHS